MRDTTSIQAYHEPLWSGNSWVETESSDIYALDRPVMTTIRKFKNLQIREIAGLYFIIEIDDFRNAIFPAFKCDYERLQRVLAKDTIQGVRSIAIGRTLQKANQIFNDIIRHTS